MKFSFVPLVLAAAVLGSAAARAESELHVYMPQGVVKAVESYVVPIMRDKYDTKVVITPSLSAQALTKAVAQREAPEVSVFMLDEGPWKQGNQAGLWDKIEAENLQQIPQRFHGAEDRGAAYLLYLLGLLYDEKALAEAGVKPPTSYADLTKPEYKGKVTLPGANSTFSYALLFKLNEMAGADAAKTVDPGFETLGQVADNVGVFHGGASTLIPLFSQRQAWVGFNASFPAQRLAAEGVPIRWVAPAEGAIAIASYVAVAKDAPARDAAQQFVNLILSPEYQAVQSEMAYGGYVNPNTQLNPDFAKTSVFKAADIEQASLMPWDVYLEQRSELNSRYQREIETR